MVAQEYSQRLGALSQAQFQAALEHFDLGAFVRAEPVPWGLFGQNVFLTSTAGEYVLRGAPHYAWQFPKERLFTHLLHQGTPVPVPWPYLVELSDALFGWSYAIMPRLSGLQLGDRELRQGLSAQDRLGIARAMGETLAHAHTLTWPCAGEYDLGTDGIRPLDVPFDEWIIWRLRCLLEEAISLSDRTTDADVAWVEDLITQAREALAVPFEACFVMQDYKEGNVVALSQDGVWRISGLFDLMEPYFGDGEADLCRSVAVYAEEDVELARAFVRAYVAGARRYGRPLRPGFAARFPIYMLLDRLIIWQYGQRHGVWWERSLTLREWAEPYTSLSVF